MRATMRAVLVLFDIDGTLLSARGAGSRAMVAAGRELFHASFTTEGVTFAGSLDALIWGQLCAVNEVEDTPAHHDAFRARYASHLREGLATAAARPLAGARELVDALEGAARGTLGILSGNWPETGRLKLASSGLEPDRFPVSAWGDDGTRRAALVPAALGRYSRHAGRSLEAGAVVIVGDTPADVACARENGCRSIAVATGGFGRGELEATGADLVVDDLSATSDLVGWIHG